jgi:hypothetical protein
VPSFTPLDWSSTISGSMPIPRDIREELIAKRAAEHSAAQRDKLIDLVLTALLCLVWSALGIFLILLGAHLTHRVYARVAFYAGIAVGNGGIIFTLLAAYRRGEKRGDW